MAEIAIRDVRKSYDANEVIRGVNAEIADGEFVVILGPSGCGKSSLLRMIAGLEKITSGTIEIAGKRVNDLEPRQRGCAMVFQNYALYPHMSVEDNIGYALKVAGIPKAERKQKIVRTATLLGLESYLDRKPMQLSGGQRQRVAMGRAIIREPQVFLFDEPLSNLDAKLRVQMRAEIRRLHRRLGATSIFVTHDQTEAMALADRLIVMNLGQIEQIGTPREIYNNPETRFVGEFIGSPPMAFFDAVVDGSNRAILSSAGDFTLPLGKLNLTQGQQVTIGIRAEALKVSRGHREGEIPARLEFVEDLGSGCLLHLDLHGSQVVVYAQGDVEFSANESVSLMASPQDIHVFETGLSHTPAN